MKRILVLTLLLMSIASFAFADRETTTITAYTNSMQLIKAGDWKVYRVTFTATTAGGSFAIYDSLTYPTSAQSLTAIMTEGQEATANDSQPPYDFTNKPLEGSTGLYLDVHNAIVVVEYE